MGPPCRIHVGAVFMTPHKCLVEGVGGACTALGWGRVRSSAGHICPTPHQGGASTPSPHPPRSRPYWHDAPISSFTCIMRYVYALNFTRVTPSPPSCGGADVYDFTSG